MCWVSDVLSFILSSFLSQIKRICLCSYIEYQLSNKTVLINDSSTAMNFAYAGKLT